MATLDRFGLSLSKNTKYIKMWAFAGHVISVSSVKFCGLLINYNIEHLRFRLHTDK